MQNTALLWHNGRIKPWADAHVHVSAHALHYGSSVFEGVRVYATPRGPAFFRLHSTAGCSQLPHTLCTHQPPASSCSFFR